jgi:hypothetical protein
MKRIILFSGLVLIFYAPDLFAQDAVLKDRAFLKGKVDSLASQLKAGKIKDREFETTFRHLCDSVFARDPILARENKENHEHLKYQLTTDSKIADLQKMTMEQSGTITRNYIMLLSSGVLNMLLIAFVARKKGNRA